MKKLKVLSLMFTSLIALMLFVSCGDDSSSGTDPDGENTKPTAMFTVSPEMGTIATEFTFDASSSSDTEDEATALEVRFDFDGDGNFDTDWSTEKIITHKYSVAGTYNAKLEVKDSGDLTAEAVKTITVSEEANTAPVAMLTVSPEMGTVATEFTFDASSSSDIEDEATALEVRFDFDGDGNFDTDWSSLKIAKHKYSAAGTYNAKLEVKDSGNLISEAVKTVTVSEEANTAPVAMLTVSPEMGTVATEFTFDASSSSDGEDEATVLEVRFDFDGDGNFDTDWSSEKIVNHKYSVAGTYNAKLEVKDSGDLTAEAVKTITVNEEVNTAPVAMLAVNPEMGTLTTEFTFDASSSSDGEDEAAVLEVRFDFDGDGNFDTDWSSEKVATHKYSAVGTYNAKVEVKDSGDLTAEAVKTVTVIETPIPEMVLVEGGSFEMGFEGFSPDEAPVHTVTFEDFYIGKYEVTNAEYVAFLNEQGNSVNGQTCLNIEDERCHIYEENGQFLVKEGKENYPVIFVSWYGARAYAEWIGGRLPSESEWEYAARGGKQSQGYTYSGSEEVGDVAWYYENSINPDNELDNGRGSHPVGLKEANELGIHDMSGNAWEWCEDKWHNDYNGAPTDGSPWIDGGSDPRIIRGGSWGGFASMCRVFYRAGFYPELNPDANSFHDYSFRVVMDAK